MNFICINCQIVKCSGDKCRIHHNDGVGFHCESCYGAEHEDALVQKKIKQQKVVILDLLIVVETSVD